MASRRGKADATFDRGSTTPVQPQCAESAAEIASLHCVLNQWQQLPGIRWCIHLQQGSTAAPALQVFRQQQGQTVADQHGFKQTVSQQQTPVVQRDGSVIVLQPLPVDPGDGSAHASASSSGCSFHCSSSASLLGSESATMPQPAWARRVSPCRSRERIKMLLSKLPSQLMRSIDPQ